MRTKREATYSISALSEDELAAIVAQLWRSSAIGPISEELRDRLTELLAGKTG